MSLCVRRCSPGISQYRGQELGELVCREWIAFVSIYIGEGLGQHQELYTSEDLSWRAEG